MLFSSAANMQNREEVFGNFANSVNLIAWQIGQTIFISPSIKKDNIANLKAVRRNLYHNLVINYRANRNTKWPTKKVHLKYEM